MSSDRANNLGPLPCRHLRRKPSRSLRCSRWACPSPERRRCHPNLYTSGRLRHPRRPSPKRAASSTRPHHSASARARRAAALLCATRDHSTPSTAHPFPRSRADYPAHDVKPREYAAKVGGGEISPSKFEATTSYRFDYPAHAVSPRIFAEKGAQRPRLARRQRTIAQPLLTRPPLVAPLFQLVVAK